MNRLTITAFLVVLLTALGHARITVTIAGVLPVSIPVLVVILAAVSVAAAAACWAACRAVLCWPHLHTAAAP
jgi:hypothetical protein